VAVAATDPFLFAMRKHARKGMERSQRPLPTAAFRGSFQVLEIGGDWQEQRVDPLRAQALVEPAAAIGVVEDDGRLGQAGLRASSTERSSV
jgi:hypothetical protein